MCSEHLHQPAVGQNHLTHAYCIIVLNISWSLLNAVLKVKNGMVVSVSVITLVVMRLLGRCAHCCWPASQESVVPHITSLGRGPHSKFEVHFLLNAYHFCTIIKLKNCKSNRRKSRILSISFFHI